MSDWTAGVCPGYRTKTLQYGNGTIVVHRPELTPEERARRMEGIKEAAARLIIAANEAARERATTGRMA